MIRTGAAGHGGSEEKENPMQKSGRPHRQHTALDSYSALVIGASIGELATAALLARYGGQRVLVLERHYTAIEIQTFLPAFNTGLIVISGLCLLAGFLFIRRKRIRYHHRTMITATIFAALFLIVYVLRAWLLGSTPFQGTGWIRALYLVILFSHMVLATAVAPLALITLYRAWRGDFQRHRRIARITLPIWLYVVVTGWLVYWMLYVR